MKAANDAILGQEDENQFQESKVRDGKTSYNMEEYSIGRECADQQVEKDLTEGNVNRYMLKILADPKAVPYWEQSRFENLRRSEENMKQIKKQVLKAKREARLNTGTQGTSLTVGELSLDKELEKAKAVDPIAFEANEYDDLD